jgi:hypothetical protein
VLMRTFLASHCTITLSLNLPVGQGPGYAKDEWIFPYVRFLYLTHDLNIGDIDLCGPDLEDRVNAAADEMLVMINTIRCETEEPSSWITLSMNEIPRIVSLRKQTSLWLGSAAKKQSQALTAAPDAGGRSARRYGGRRRGDS